MLSAPVGARPYSIGAVARLAGVPLETLRIWERRYRLLTPGRTAGGHRLYSEQDVELMRAVKALVDSGVRIGTIAQMSPAEIRGSGAPGRPRETHDVDDKTPAALLDEMIAAAAALEESKLARLLDRALLGLPPLDVVADVYLPLLRAVGDRWHAGTLSVAAEHLAEKLVTGRVHALLHHAGPVTSTKRALCACPPDERHELGLLAAALALKEAGIAVTLLGADVPAADLADAAARVRPSALVLGATTPLSRQARSTLVPALLAPPLVDVPLFIGGDGARELALELQARARVVVVDRIADIAARVDAL